MAKGSFKTQIDGTMLSFDLEEELVDQEYTTRRLNLSIYERESGTHDLKICFHNVSADEIENLIKGLQKTKKYLQAVEKLEML